MSFSFQWTNVQTNEGIPNYFQNILFKSQKIGENRFEIFSTAKLEAMGLFCLFQWSTCFCFLLPTDTSSFPEKILFCKQSYWCWTLVTLRGETVHYTHGILETENILYIKLWKIAIWLYRKDLTKTWKSEFLDFWMSHFLFMCSSPS